MSVRPFLTRLFGRCNPHLFVNIWSIPSRGSGRFLPVKDRDYATELVERLDKAGEDVYFGVCPHTQKPIEGRGASDTVACVPALWADIDIAHETAHNADVNTLPPDEDAVADLLQDSGLPWPSILVRSGHGLHCYWTLTEPVAPDLGASLVQGVQIALQKAAEKRGWQIDNTSDLARILRIPGTHNYKIRSEPSEVSILADTGEDFEASAFQPFASTMQPKTTAPRIRVEVKYDPSKALSIDEIKARLKTLRKSESADLLRKVFRGESIAERGKRDKALQKACSTLAYIAPHNPPDQLAQIFVPMLSEWVREPDAKQSLATELGKVEDKIARAHIDKHSADAHDATIAEAAKSILIACARAQEAPPGAPVNDKPYSNEELDLWSAEQGTTRNLLSRQLIIQYKDVNWVFCCGRYGSPIWTTNLLASLPRDLSPAPGVSLTRKTKTGEARKTVTDLVCEYGAVARHNIAEMGAEYSRYDARTQTFHEAVACLRPIVPQYHPQIDEWLQHLGGDKKDKFLDWLATSTNLQKPSSALYISGPASAGKSMLAQGLARLWHDGGPSLLENVIDKFNDDLIRCPLVWADEQLPLDWGKKAASARLREIITADTRTLNRKYHPGASLKGCVRVILTANNRYMLQLDSDAIGEYDLEALAARILHIETPSAAAKYLRDLGGREATEGWVDGDMIAAHVLWLVQNRQVTHGNRLLVEGDIASVAPNLAINTRLGHQILDWLINYINKGGNGLPDVVVGGGQILLYPRAIHEAWEAYIQTREIPLVGAISRQLSGICHPADIRNGLKDRKRLKSLKLDLFYEYYDRVHLGDVDAMRERIERPVQTT